MLLVIELRGSRRLVPVKFCLFFVLVLLSGCSGGGSVEGTLKTHDGQPLVGAQVIARSRFWRCGARGDRPIWPVSVGHR